MRQSCVCARIERSVCVARSRESGHREDVLAGHPDAPVARLTSQLRFGFEPIVLVIAERAAARLPVLEGTFRHGVLGDLVVALRMEIHHLLLLSAPLPIA